MKSKSDWFFFSYDKIVEVVVLLFNYFLFYGKILVNVLWYN